MADDHALMLGSMGRLLRAESDFELVGEAHELDLGVQIVNQQRADVLVLALSLPDGSRLGAIADVRARMRANIVFATMEADPAFVQSALAAGAVGYVCKDRAEVELPPAVRAAARGFQYVSARATERLQERHARARAG